MEKTNNRKRTYHQAFPNEVNHEYGKKIKKYSSNIDLNPNLNAIFYDPIKIEKNQHGFEVRILNSFTEEELNFIQDYYKEGNLKIKF